MVAAGSPTGWCLLSLCVQWSNSIIPSAFIHCTASTDDTTWTATNTGLCVWVRGEDELWMCVWVAQCRLCTYTLYLCQLGMKIVTALEASVHVGMDVCSCRWVVVSVDNTDSCNIHSPVLVHLLVPPQVGAFLSNVSSGAIPPVHQASSLLQPVCGCRVCVCVACAWVWEVVCVCVCVCVCDAMHPIGSKRHTPWGLLSWQLDRTAITAISGYSLLSDVGLASPPI